MQTCSASRQTLEEQQTMTDLQETAEDIKDRFDGHYDVDVDEAREKLEELVHDYTVPVREARRTVMNHYIDESGIDSAVIFGNRDGTDELVNIADINEDETWITIEATVVQLWDPLTESMDQVGLLGDETDTIKFTKWDDSGLQALEEGQSYRFESVVTDEFDGSFSVKLTKVTEITEIDDIETPDLEDRLVTVEDITEPDEWVSLEVQVTELWEPQNESIGQVGLMGDETGTIKFTKWADSELPELQEGNVYRLDSVVTDEFDDRFSVKLNNRSTVTELDEDIEVGDNHITVTGAMVDLQQGSGLIKRCPEEDCTRVLQNSRCSEHGEVEGEFDMRLKAVIDDGNEVYDALFNLEATEAITGIELEDAKEMAKDALDTTVVAEEMKRLILGRYYQVTGPRFRGYVLVEGYERVGGVPDVDEVLSEIEVNA